MAKTKTFYQCQSCGTTSPKWLGKCPGCEEWNTLVEEKRLEEPKGSSKRLSVNRLARTDSANFIFLNEADQNEEVLKESKSKFRYRTGMSELDRVLGGGLVKDSLVLLGGDPGIGKSTILLQALSGILKNYPDLCVLYASGEESLSQLRERALRIGIKPHAKFCMSSETSFEGLLSTIEEVKPQVLIVDSLQTFSSDQLESAPGSVSQVREIATQLMILAKQKSIATALVGHVTKDGNIAGPKVVEHLVDTVLYFEGDTGLNYRLLRTVKNRFGSVRELGVFEMDSSGLREVLNPSQLFLSEREESVPGVAVTVSMEGSRPILVELQALVNTSYLSLPRRTSVGMDQNRISMVTAILERHEGVSLSKDDVFFNVAGGLRLSEPACDLAAAIAIWSSKKEKPNSEKFVFLGELGLTGEVRKVSSIDIRLQEAKRLGFAGAVIPKSTPKNLIPKDSSFRIIPVSSVSEISKIRF